MTSAGPEKRTPWSGQRWEAALSALTLAAVFAWGGGLSGIFDHTGQIFLGCLLGGALLNVAPLVSWAVVSMLGVQTTHIFIGTGPVVWRGVGRSQVVLLRTVPLSIRFTFLPALAHYSRDVRRSLAARLFVPAVLCAIPALIAPGYVTVTTLVSACPSLLAFALAKNRESGRHTIARIFLASTPERDPALYDPAVATVVHVHHALGFGDLDAAQRLADERGIRPALRRLMFDETIHEIRGELDSAHTVLTRYPEAARGFATLEILRLGFVAAEAGRADPARVLAEAQATVGALAALAKSDMYFSLMALYRLETGQAQDARAWVNKQFARATTPLELADSLCTRARVEAALGRMEHASRTLRRAQSIAPWYARVAAVRGRLGIDASAGPVTTRDLSEITAQGEPAADPWAAPSS